MSAPSPNLAETGPSDTVRSVVSFLLFLHLFAIGVAVLSRANSVTPAPLEARLRQVPGIEPYIALTGLDWPYTYFLMLNPLRNERPTWDLQIEVNLQKADGTSETLTFPDLQHMRGPRQHRYERLVSAATEMLQASSMESKIPEGIVRGLVKEKKATGGTIRIRGKTAPEREFEPFPSEHAPQPLYEARILVAGNNVSLFKLDSATESAPASRGTGPRPSTPPSSPPTAPPANNAPAAPAPFGPAPPPTK